MIWPIAQQLYASFVPRVFCSSGVVALMNDADRERVMDGLAAVRGSEAVAQDVGVTLQRLAQRWFVLRNVHAGTPISVQPRYAMTFMRGPMTRVEIGKARGVMQPEPSEAPEPPALASLHAEQRGE